MSVTVTLPDDLAARLAARVEAGRSAADVVRDALDALESLEALSGEAPGEAELDHWMDTVVAPRAERLARGDEPVLSASEFAAFIDRLTDGAG